MAIISAHARDIDKRWPGVRRGTHTFVGSEQCVASGVARAFTMSALGRCSDGIRAAGDTLFELGRLLFFIADALNPKQGRHDEIQSSDWCLSWPASPANQ